MNKPTTISVTTKLTIKMPAISNKPLYRRVTSPIPKGSAINEVTIGVLAVFGDVGNEVEPA